jgi:PAS domain S-box-containing protein
MTFWRFFNGRFITTCHFFSNTQTVFCIIGFEGSFRQINGACESIFGYDRAKFLKLEFMELVHPDNKRMVDNILDELSESIETKTFNCLMLDAKGKYRDFVWQATPSLKEFAFYAVGIEIGDYKHQVLHQADEEAQEQLTIFQEKYADLQMLLEDLQQKVPTIGEEAIPIAQLFQLIQEGVILQHKNGKIYPVNENQVKHIFGDIPNTEQFSLLWDAAKDNPRPDIPIKFLWLKKSGKMVHLHLSTKTIVDANQQLFGRAICFTDVTEQDKLKHKIESLQDQTTLVTQTRNEGILTWDLLTNEVNYSGSWKALLGYHEEDNLLGKRIETWQSRIYPVEYKQTIDLLKRYLDGKCQNFESEHRLAHKDGSYRWMSVKGQALRDRSGRAYRFIGAFTDITERRTIAESISGHDLSKIPSDILNVLPEAIFCVDTKTYKIINTNAAALQMYNYNAEEWSKLCFNQLFPDPLQFNKEWRFILRDKIYHIPISSQKKKNGETFVAELSGGSYEWQGQLLIVVVVRDITDRRNIERKIREERQQYGTAFNNAPLMILCKDRNGKITKANRYAAKLLNQRPEQLVGLVERDLKMDFSDKYYQTDTEILNTGEQVLGLIEKYHDHFYHIDKIPYRDAAGNILGILVFIIDVEFYLSIQQSAQ